MPFSFPSSPAVNDQSTQNGRTYSWSGYAWEIVATPAALSASVITSGTLDAARLPLATTGAAGAVIVGTGLGVSSGTVSVTYGTNSTSACRGDDSRLSDTRTPTDGSVTTAKVANDSITYAKLQNVPATDRLLGRSSAGSGDVEEITCTAFGRSLIGSADAAAARTTLSVQPTASPTFTGTVTVPGLTATAAILADDLSSANSVVYSFDGDPNTGIGRGGADIVTVVTAGVERVRVGSNGRVQFFANSEKFGVQLNNGSTGNGPFIGSDGADIFTISTSGGAERVRVKSTGSVRFVPLSADPSTGNEAGDVYYNSSTNKLRVYNGTSWVDLH